MTHSLFGARDREFGSFELAGLYLYTDNIRDLARDLTGDNIEKVHKSSEH